MNKSTSKVLAALLLTASLAACAQPAKVFDASAYEICVGRILDEDRTLPDGSRHLLIAEFDSCLAQPMEEGERTRLLVGKAVEALGQNDGQAFSEAVSALKEAGVLVTDRKGRTTDLARRLVALRDLDLNHPVLKGHGRKLVTAARLRATR